jgi:hypothetical protein
MYPLTTQGLNLNILNLFFAFAQIDIFFCLYLNIAKGAKRTKFKRVSFITGCIHFFVVVFELYFVSLANANECFLFVVRSAVGF